MKNIACHIGKQRMWQPSSHHITATLMVSPEGTQDGNMMPTIKSSDTAATPQRSTARKLKVRKHRILAPESWGAYRRNDFSEPRLLHLPIHRKALNSLTWDVWFSLINSNLSNYLVLVAKNASISWLLPHLLGAVPQSHLRGWLPGLSTQFCPPNKT